MPPGFLEWVMAQYPAPPSVDPQAYFNAFPVDAQQQLLAQYQALQPPVAPTLPPPEVSTNPVAVSGPIGGTAPSTPTDFGTVNPVEVSGPIGGVAPAPPPPTIPAAPPTASAPGMTMDQALMDLYGGFINGQNTLARDQFEEQQRQFNEQLSFSQQQFQAQLGQLAATNQLNAATLAEATAARQQRDAQFMAQMAQNQSQFERNFALEQQRFGLSQQQIAAQIEQMRLQNQIAQQRLGLDARQIDAQIEQMRAQTALQQQQFGLSERDLAARIADNQARLALADRQLTQAGSQFDRSLAEQNRAALVQEAFQLQQLQQEMAQFTAQQTGFLNGAPTLAREAQQFSQGERLAAIMGNPRNIGQSLGMLGYNPQQARGFVENSPFYGMLSAGLPYEFQPQTLGQAISGVTTGGATPFGNFGSPLATMGQTATATPLMGRQLNARSTLAAQRSGSPVIPLIEGIASMQGTDPNALFGEFREFLPQGAPTPLSSFL